MFVCPHEGVSVMHTTMNSQLKQTPLPQSQNRRCATKKMGQESQKRSTNACSPQACVHASRAAPPLGLEVQNSRAIYSCDL
jgi:hypothetical protein